MAQLKVLVQSLARTHSSPRDFLKAINRLVADNIDSKSFITMSYAVIDLERHEMVLGRAGHCPLILVPGIHRRVCASPRCTHRTGSSSA